MRRLRQHAPWFVALGFALSGASYAVASGATSSSDKRIHACVTLLPGLDRLAAWLRRHHAPAVGREAVRDGATMADPVTTLGTDQGEE